MGKLITSCILNRDWTTCEVSFPSFLQYFQKKRRFRSTISDPFPSLSSDFFYWSFFHNWKCSVYKILSVIFRMFGVILLFSLLFSSQKREKNQIFWLFLFFWVQYFTTYEDNSATLSFYLLFISNEIWKKLNWRLCYSFFSTRSKTDNRFQS